VSSAGDQRGFVGNVDRLADVAMQTFSALARRAGLVTLLVALMAGVVTGSMVLVGLAAFPGNRATVAVLGGLIMAGAVGAPLLAASRLYAIPRASAKLAGELRGLLGRSDDAKRIVIDTVAYEEGSDGPGPEPGRPLPSIVVRSQQYSRLGSLASKSGEFALLAATLRRLTTVPLLLLTSLLLTLLGALLGFVFLLIWIF
jgi:hypothetical protein